MRKRRGGRVIDSCHRRTKEERWQNRSLLWLYSWEIGFDRASRTSLTSGIAWSGTLLASTSLGYALSCQANSLFRNTIEIVNRESKYPHGNKFLVQREWEAVLCHVISPIEDGDGQGGACGPSVRL